MLIHLQRSASVVRLDKSQFREYCSGVTYSMDTAFTPE